MFVYTIGDVIAVLFFALAILLAGFAYGLHKMTQWTKGRK